ncbi:hypothetical protein [Agrobacterium fabrum]|uniref:hypothetical protein n=1 Tax=Agrobacterium fabrum TaxID=1176649 RepID=UPI0024738AEA|nr:hypothetical protein [Agrobacterium fabrum]MDH6298750.1 hypothetical protein [Agrobacterium fabrum]
MSALYKIVVINNSSQAQPFSLFQAASGYDSPAQVVSTSLDCQPLRPFSEAGTTLSFSVDAQIYAGAQETMPNTFKNSMAESHFLSRSLIAASAPQTFAVQKVNPTQDIGSSAANFTIMSVDPVGLSPAIAKEGLAPGAFCISVPSYTPPVPSYKIGNAAVNQDGSVILSSFIQAPPNQLVAITVSQVFYVAAVAYPTGSVIDYPTAASAAAKCDFSTGYTTYTVSYGSDGRFSVRAAY